MSAIQTGNELKLTSSDAYTDGEKWHFPRYSDVADLRPWAPRFVNNPEDQQIADLRKYVLGLCEMLLSGNNPIVAGKKIERITYSGAWEIWGHSKTEQYIRMPVDLDVPLITY